VHRDGLKQWLSGGSATRSGSLRGKRWVFLSSSYSWLPEVHLWQCSTRLAGGLREIVAASLMKSNNSFSGRRGEATRR